MCQVGGSQVTRLLFCRRHDMILLRFDKGEQPTDQVLSNFYSTCDFYEGKDFERDLLNWSLWDRCSVNLELVFVVLTLREGAFLWNVFLFFIFGWVFSANNLEYVPSFFSQ